jgi:hypothetical protein
MRPYYEDEERVVWLKDHEVLARMGYVRERWLLCSIRTGPVKPRAGEVLIGYAALKKSTVRQSEKGFYRRIFILLPEDRFFEPKGCFQNSLPPDAVDPLFVQAGQPGRRPGEKTVK